MRKDWDRRAKEFVTFVAPSESWEGFRESGRSDTLRLLSGMNGMPFATMTVLDIGCGVGRMDEHLAPLFRELHGIDVSLEMIRRAKKSLDGAGYENAFFHLGSGHDLRQFRGETFDFVFSYITFQHIPRKIFLEYIPEIWRVLKYGGLLRFQMVSLRIPRWLYVWMRRSKNRTANIHYEPPDEDTWSMRFYGQAELLSALSACGFAKSQVSSEPMSFRSVVNVVWVTTQKILETRT